MKLPWPIRESQCRVSSFCSSGSALVATTIAPAEMSASAPTVAGARRSAGASAKQRNGSSGIRNRGPGDQPPSANSTGCRAEFQMSSTTTSATISPASDAEAATPEQHAPAMPAATTGVMTRRPRWLRSSSTSDAEARQALAEEARRLPAAARTLAGRARVGEVQRVAERPRVEREEREQPDEAAGAEGGEPPQRAVLALPRRGRSARPASRAAGRSRPRALLLRLRPATRSV